MKKTLLTLVALVGLTWNVNAQDAPPEPDRSLPPIESDPTDYEIIEMLVPPGEMFVNCGEGGFEFNFNQSARFTGLVRSLADMPFLTLHGMLMFSEKDSITFTYVPSRLKNGVRMPDLDDQVSIIVSRDLEKPCGLDFQLKHQKQNKFPFELELAYRLSTLIKKRDPINGDELHLALPKKKRSLEWNDPSRITPNNEMNHEKWVSDTPAMDPKLNYNTNEIVNHKFNDGKIVYTIIITTYLRSLKWNSDPKAK